MADASFAGSTARSRPLLFVTGLMLATLLVPYGLLVLLSIGSGWSFPNLFPDRGDFAPWKRVAADHDGMLKAAATSLAMSVAVSIPSTAFGLLAGRAIRLRGSSAWMFAAWLPFVLSPMIVGVCLYDLTVRMRLVSTAAGVIACQTLFAFAFATVLFSELWSPRIERAEHVVATLGGGAWAVWRHAVIPQASGLITVCLIQTALVSWLDYGLASLLGGGVVKTLTLSLFASIREASVNQAALSGLVLLLPTVAGYFTTGAILAARARKERAAA